MEDQYYSSIGTIIIHGFIYDFNIIMKSGTVYAMLLLFVAILSSMQVIISYST